MPFSGIIQTIGYYGDSIPKMIIRINKDQSPQLDESMDGRVPIRMVINGSVYQAGLRSTPKMEYHMVCSNINNPEGRPARLSEVLLEQGLCANQKVGLKFNEDRDALTLLDGTGKWTP